MRIVDCRIRLIPTLIGLALIALVGWCAVRQPTPEVAMQDPSCTADPKLRVTVGGQLFAVPRAFRPYIFRPDDPDDAVITDADEFCQRPQDSPIEAELVSLNIGQPPYVFEGDALTQPLEGVHIEIWNRSALPRARLAFEGNVENMISCGRPVRTVETYYGRMCRTPYYAYSEAVLLAYTFYDGRLRDRFSGWRYPAPSVWHHLHARVLALVRSLDGEGKPSASQ